MEQYNYKIFQVNIVIHRMLILIPFCLLFLQLTPVERYAVSLVELITSEETLEELEAAEVILYNMFDDWTIVE